MVVTRVVRSDRVGQDGRRFRPVCRRTEGPHGGWGRSRAHGLSLPLISCRLWLVKASVMDQLRNRGAEHA